MVYDMMAETRRYALNAQLAIDQILQEAQHRWLRPAEICEILQNYKNFYIASEPPNRPSSGSLFLFDRKVLRYFRKDGHNWRKKKDGKTVKEAHERLKAGSIDVLHCYYAHGEDNENFQRRSYWMLLEELSHIVLVHYREVKGNRTNFNRIRDADVNPNGQQTEENISNFEVDSAASSKVPQYDYQVSSQVTDTTSLNSTQASEFEDAESAYRHQASPGFHSIHDLLPPAAQKMEVGSIPYYPVPLSDNNQGQYQIFPDMNVGLVSQGERSSRPVDNGMTNELQQNHGFSTWEGIVESRPAAFQSFSFSPSFLTAQSSSTSIVLGLENELGQILTGSFSKRQELGRHSNGLGEWQVSDHDSTNTSKWPMNDKPDHNQNLADKTNNAPSGQPILFDLTTKLNDNNRAELSNLVGHHTTYPAEQSRHPMQDQCPTLRSAEDSLKLDSDYPSLRQPLLEGVREGLNLRKLDSFDRWMSKELGDVTESDLQLAPGTDWETVASEGRDEDSCNSSQVPLDNYIVGPSLSQDQLYSIIDFSPSWAYSGSEIKILVMGRFLRSQLEVENMKWACMFGEVEVPAEIIADGVLRCHTPLLENGRVPFYVTCANRLACSEVREFEFRNNAAQDVDPASPGSISSNETLLHMRFGKLLSLGSASADTSVMNKEPEISHLCNKISALLKDETEWEQMLYLTKQDEFSADKVKDQLLQKLLKEKLHHWLLQKVTEGGRGPNVLDEGGQGVLHFAAALGYDWALLPTIAAGVSVNFRDANGWTALHWAAYYGRERTVAILILLGAAPGALTDPTPEYPSGRTPYDLAHSNGHKGISGYLAESSLSSHLVLLKLKDSKEVDGIDRAVETVSERFATPVGDGDLPHGLSLKDSLAAVRNATQAAARIHQVFRAQSFQRKQLKEYGDREFGISDERALSLLALKTSKGGQYNEPVHAAAVRIQNKFRSWKGRKDFLLIRQRIIKIQAHVRGHQVRKNYKKIIWSVGILDKVILRWRRKGKGLSRFKHETLAAGTSMQGIETKVDEYDFLKEGRKQTEERFQKALARVKSMVQYPEARDQYRRLLNVVSEMQEKKAAYDKILSNPEVEFDDDLIDLDTLLEDDAYMSTAF